MTRSDPSDLTRHAAAFACFSCGQLAPINPAEIEHVAQYTWLLCDKCPESALPPVILPIERYVHHHVIPGFSGMLDVDELADHAKWADAAWARLRGFLLDDVDQTAFISFSLPDGILGVELRTNDDAAPTIDDPMAALLGFDAIDQGTPTVLIVRTLERAPAGQPDDTAPTKIVRAWMFSDQIADPVDAATLRRNYTVDGQSGDDVDVDPALQFASSWLITGNPGGRP